MLTRDDAGRISVEWPAVIQPEWRVSHELLVLMVEQHNRHVDRIDALEAETETMQARLDNWHDLGDDLAEVLERLIADEITAQPGLPELVRRIRACQGTDK